MVQIQCYSRQSFVVVFLFFFSAHPLCQLNLCRLKPLAACCQAIHLLLDVATQDAVPACRQYSLIFNQHRTTSCLSSHPVSFLSLCEITFNETRFFLFLSPFTFFFNLNVSSSVNRGGTQRELFHYNSTHTLFTPTA